MGDVSQSSTQFSAKIVTMAPPNQTTYAQGQGLNLKPLSPTREIQALGQSERQGLKLSSGPQCHSRALTPENRPANSHSTTTKPCSGHQAPSAPSLINDMDGPRNITRPPDSPDWDLQLPLFQQAHPGFQGDSSQRSTTTKPCSDHQAPSAPSLIGDMDGSRSVSWPPDSPDRDRQLPLFQEAHPGFQGIPNKRSTTAKCLSDGQTLPAPGRIDDTNGPRSVSRPLGSLDRDNESPFLEATQNILEAPSEQRSSSVRHTLPRSTHDAADPIDATKDMHEDIEPYKPYWEYFGFTKDGPPPLPNSDTAAAPYELELLWQWKRPRNLWAQGGVNFTDSWGFSE